jgi:hypothetical protein
MWLGSLALTPQWAAFALAIGAGAILQVLVEVGAFLARGPAGASKVLTPPVLGGVLVGVAVMYATGALVKV